MESNKIIIVLVALLTMTLYLIYRQRSVHGDNKHLKNIIDEFMSLDVDAKGVLNSSNEILNILMANYYWDLFRSSGASETYTMKLNASNKNEGAVPLFISISKQGGNTVEGILNQYSDTFGNIDRLRASGDFSGLELKETGMGEQIKIDDKARYIVSVVEK